MKTARLFNDGTIVDAYDVFSGKVSRYNDFVDVEEDFRVVYWSGAKHKQGEPGRPHFKIYLTREEYKKLSPEQKTRLQILKDQRHYQESEWHRDWEDRFEEFAEIEKTIINQANRRRKRADAYIQSSNLCIEFQHSFINYDFEERNSFYSEMGYDTVWIYDLTSQNVKNEDGTYTILENNAKGFFRIAENPDNLKYNTVFIQAKDRQLYLITELRRKEIDSDKKSTIRVFEPECVIDPDDFVEMIKNAEFSFMKKQVEGDFSSFLDSFVVPVMDEETPSKPALPKPDLNDLQSVDDLWDSKYYFMILYNPKEQSYIRIVKSNKNDGDMERIGKWNYVVYQNVYWDINSGKYTVRSDFRHHMSWEEEKEKCWQLIWGFIDWYR